MTSRKSYHAKLVSVLTSTEISTPFLDAQEIVMKTFKCTPQQAGWYVDGFCDGAHIRGYKIRLDKE